MKKADHFFSEYYSNTFMKLEKQLKKAKESFDEEAIHKFRVSVKYIRALHQLTEILSQGKLGAGHQNKLFKKTFQHSGEIREAQLNVQLAKTYIYHLPLRQQVTAYLIEIIESSEKKLAKSAKKVTLDEFISIKQQNEQLLNNINTKEIVLQAKHYILSTTNKLRQVKSVIESEETFHDIRKLLKLIKAILLILTEYNKATYQTVLEELTIIEKRIGKWHDIIVFRDALIHYSHKVPIIDHDSSESVQDTFAVLEDETFGLEEEILENINPLIDRLLELG
jgi:CHAD domain-containing protein